MLKVAKRLNKSTLEKWREDFPILKSHVNGKPLVYFDNAASSQKPSMVINAVSNYYEQSHSNVHRGVHYLSEKATMLFEDSRKKLQHFIGAANEEEVIFTKGTTDGINLVANSFGGLLKEGDEIIISYMEHHSNIVPWQILCEKKNIQLKVIPITESGELIMDQFYKLLSPATKLIAVNHVSNTLGTVNPVEEIIAQAHKIGAKVLIDAAQSVPHMKINVQELKCDFLTFSAHKMFGPTGVGVLYGKKELLDAMPPYQGGGDMIKNVSFEKTTYNELPHKFEAGTPNIAGVIGLGAAVDYIQEIGIENIGNWEHQLLTYAEEQLKNHFPNIHFYGTATNKASVISFLLDKIHPYDTGTLLDKMGIAVRTGHHCTQPLMDWYKIPGTVRASFAFYNTMEEIDIFISALQRVEKMLK